MGLLGDYRDSVTLVNRTSRTLSVRYDGEDIPIPSGENAGFPRIAVEFAKRQNPLMGSKHPNDPRRMIFLVGVKAAKGDKQRDDISPISDDVLHTADSKLELVDRSGEFHGVPLRKVAILNRGYTAYEAEAAQGGAFDVNKSID